MGKNFKVKRGPARGPDAYPVEVCSVRFKDPETGQWVKRPKDAPAPGKTRKGRAVDPGLIVMRTVQEVGEDREVTGARVVLGGLRAEQRRGKAKKSDVRETEKELSRDALRTFNPRLADEVDRERMHEAHRSDKAKRGASTKARNKAAGIGKKQRPADVVRTELLRTEELVRDARRRHDRAKTAAAKTRHAESLKKRRAKLARLRDEFRRVEG
ncbi:hypothetical protein V3W47_18930 [Deinococcus sp. YIM 134068]|uniref:hypothetical protein n=1 Tax=Deinococcus lichenicola TaxID=3118910 RepID=UPI002F93D580